MYALDIPVSEVRSKIREEFKKNKNLAHTPPHTTPSRSYMLGSIRVMYVSVWSETCAAICGVIVDGICRYWPFSKARVGTDLLARHVWVYLLLAYFSAASRMEPLVRAMYVSVWAETCAAICGVIVDHLAFVGTGLLARHVWITDIRVADMLVVKGKMEYDETIHFWKQKSHVMRYWKDEEDLNNPLKMDFLERFYRGV
ncbi:hypothetical protein SARC_06141 [Sphaeroforma arctica JP610]|uniref:Uncharacterized protein n=1 Tax=Sphaeroforma arctica JP610 TaxID=667725 RepID=A0A0L0FY22_9EUKA|nr:hypothetical protein SARC_06141 [Sphaeroforma arctica JP610]KNC81534.1 hypothetical protein SARC_06141 [Sphaeroforma arctica JP610]|eukprot:XP_014155436.1 hypothetical protein SARC_06141 [Sphaeroforma arctica JP610]